MRCHDVKQLLAHQCDVDSLGNPDALAFQEHVEQCVECHTFEQRQRSIDVLLKTSQESAPPEVSQRFSSIGHVSTHSIMQAVQQRKQISQQFETLHEQQCSRVARLRKAGTALAAILFFTLSSIPLLALAITLVQTDFMVHVLLLLSNVIDVLYVLGQYIQTGLTVVTRNSFLLTGVGFVVVLMMGMWLRLMRPPQEA
ncbi:MAG: hypothetical protein NVS4B12_06050 [Ktedonobacteraceae bacterium]